MDPNKKITGQDWLNLEIQKGLSKFVSNTSNNTPENNFQAGLGAVGSFAADTINNPGSFRSEHKESLIAGARGYVHQPKDDKDPNKPEDEKAEEEVNEEEMPDSSRVSGVNSAADNFKAFLGLGDPDRIEKRQEIKSARKENRATNRLRRAGETEYKDYSPSKNTPEDGKKTGEKIPTRKVARGAKKDRIRKAKVKFDNKTVEKNK